VACTRNYVFNISNVVVRRFETTKKCCNYVKVCPLFLLCVKRRKQRLILTVIRAKVNVHIAHTRKFCTSMICYTDFKTNMMNYYQIRILLARVFK
jgi:hypothetical protein